MANPTLVNHNTTCYSTPNVPNETTAPPTPTFSPREGHWGSNPRKLETLYCSQQSLTVLLVPHQGQKMSARLFNDATWPLVGVLATDLWVSQQYWSRIRDRTVARKSSLGGLYVRVGGLYVCARGA